MLSAVAFFVLLLLAVSMALALRYEVQARELHNRIVDLQIERDLAREEVRALTDALARGNRTPILRQTGNKTLEPSETYWGGKPRLVDVRSE